jgi:hypothetical protein
MNQKSVVKGVELRADTAIEGLQTAVPSGVTQLLVGGTTYTVPNLVTYAQSLVQPWVNVRNAHATIRQEMLTRPADTKALVGFLADLRVALQTLLGRDNEALTKFGFSPQKPRKPLTPEQKTLRAAKAKLTRQKHGTLGSKQKAALGPTPTPSVAIASDGQVTITPAPGASDVPAPPPPPASGGNASTPSKT